MLTGAFPALEFAGNPSKSFDEGTPVKLAKGEHPEQKLEGRFLHCK